MKDSSSKILFLLKSALETAQEKGKYIEYLKLSEYFNLESETSFFKGRVDDSTTSILRSCKLILKAIENEKVD